MESLSHFNFNTQERQNKLLTVVKITLFWLLVSFYQYFDRFSILMDGNYLPNTYEHWPYIRGILISIILGGIIGGSALVFLLEKWLRNMSFAKAMIYIGFGYTCLYSFITFLATFIFFSQEQLATRDVINISLQTLYDINLLPNYLLWLFITLLTMAVLLIRDKFGPKVFNAYLRGKYFRAKREERIFMFVDLQSSTTIAEGLGEVKYFNFLNNVFKCVTPGIVATKGEIYQYVGDEIVVSWEQSEGLKNANCIRCYYELTRLLRLQSEFFKTTYGVIPIFKAALHSGFVIAGEMGIVKREIVYSGDVLNTTARIQSKCNELGVYLLVSATLMEQLNPIEFGLSPQNLGEIYLRGKSRRVEVLTLEQKVQ